MLNMLVFVTIDLSMPSKLHIFFYTDNEEMHFFAPQSHFTSNSYQI